MTYRPRLGFDWPTLRFRVSRGASLLDQIDPGWAERVDLRGFDMPIVAHDGIEPAAPKAPTWSIRQVRRLIEKVDDPESLRCPKSGAWEVGLAYRDECDYSGLNKEWRRFIAQRQRHAGIVGEPVAEVSGGK